MHFSKLFFKFVYKFMLYNKKNKTVISHGPLLEIKIQILFKNQAGRSNKIQSITFTARK